MDSELYNEYKDLVYWTCWKKLAPLHEQGLLDIEEVTQDAWLEIVNSYSSYDPERSELSTWIGSITKNVCADYANKQSEIHALFTSVDNLADPNQDDEEVRCDQDLIDNALYHNGDPSIGQWSPSAFEELAAEETSEQIDTFVARLPEMERLITNLLWREEYSVPDTANYLGVDASTVRTVVQRVRSKLEQYIAGSTAKIPRLQVDEFHDPLKSEAGDYTRAELNDIYHGDSAIARQPVTGDGYPVIAEHHGVESLSFRTPQFDYDE